MKRRGEGRGRGRGGKRERERERGEMAESGWTHLGGGERLVLPGRSDDRFRWVGEHGLGPDFVEGEVIEEVVALRSASHKSARRKMRRRTRRRTRRRKRKESETEGRKRTS